MQEAFLHYLWQFQQFSSKDLKTTDNQMISVIKTGFLNSDAGPDFLNARLMLDEIEWIGSVEIHLKSSDWKTHQHTDNQVYNNVILHVVWEDDALIERPDGSQIPTLVLKPITDISLLNRYEYLPENKLLIPCAEHFKEVADLPKIAAFDKALTKRLIEKSKIVEELLRQNNQDWEETAYQLLAKNFGFKLNAEPFLKLSQNLSLKTLQKHRNSLFQIEALLFGMAGFLSIPTDEYSEKLLTEYDFLSTKYQLKTKQLNAHEWKFLRTRPANFPTIRLAQLAKLIVNQSSFFSTFIQTQNFDDLLKILRVEQSDYWQIHYHFNKESKQKLMALGKDSAFGIIINTVIPLLAAYSKQTDNQQLMDRIIDFLERLPAEENRITELWKGLGKEIRNAFDSQAGIELYNNFCLPKKCLQCAVGIAILKKN